MPDGSLFDYAAELLERSTSFDRLEARGTLRLALKEVGFDPKHIRSSELVTVVERLLPRELTARGIDDAESVVARLVADLSTYQDDSGADSPESVFRRLGGDE